jgi:gamma-glutamylcyclotransferase (GGCT)/AIG2-like uncharacterized protein YtfP
MTGDKEQHLNLFVYGSLRDPVIFRSVGGHSFTLDPSHNDPTVLLAELALLNGYRKVSPDNVYFYAVPDQNSKIEGFVIYNAPQQTMAEIDRYEGKLYDRETVRVNTAHGLIEAQAYLASPKSMRKRFGDRFHVNLIHELWLRKRIEDFFRVHTRPGEESADADIERRARRELVGTTERDLVVSHLGSGVVSDYYLEHELNRPLPSIKHLYNHERAIPYIHSYIALVIKQVLLNQFEQRLQSHYRFELDRLSQSARFYTRIISLLIALRMLNTNPKAIDMILAGCLAEGRPDDDLDLINYVKYAIEAADSIFDNRVAASEIERVRHNRQPGLTPLGFEVEFSNLGFKAVHSDTENLDSVFDGFRYFSDFALDVLTWKLGGYIDDNTDSAEPGRRGFLEMAPGRLNVIGQLSKPATSDPWVLNQLIRQIAIFFPVTPHSLHLSLQIRRNQVGKHRPLPLSFVKCLLALGGGTQERSTGRLRISRMEHDEIRRNTYGEELVFSRVSKREYQMLPDDFGERIHASMKNHILQYKFIRLDPRANYEPLIMAMKGLQLSCNPGDYLTAAQLAASPKLRYQYEELKEWSDNPTPINRSARTRFIRAIRDGLNSEAHGKPYHRLHYIDWALGAIDIQLRLFNRQIENREISQQQSTITKLVQSIKPSKHRPI